MHARSSRRPMCYAARLPDPVIRDGGRRRAADRCRRPDAQTAGIRWIHAAVDTSRPWLQPNFGCQNWPWPLVIGARSLRKPARGARVSETLCISSTATVSNTRSPRTSTHPFFNGLS